jgi:hypothetical protein
LKMIAELGIAVSARIFYAIFLPENMSGHAHSPELA